MHFFPAIKRIIFFRNSFVSRLILVGHQGRGIMTKLCELPIVIKVHDIFKIFEFGPVSMTQCHTS